MRQCDKKTIVTKTISCKDNKAYKLASPNNSKKETIEKGNNNRVY